MATATPKLPRPFRFTGWHITGILVAFFGVVIAVNVTMATLATHTFSGEVVKNSYDASQQFDHWLDEAAKEKALGWSAKLARQTDGRVVATVSGQGLTAPKVTGEAWHPLGQIADHDLTFHAVAPGTYVSDQALPDGRWRIRLKVEQGGHQWRASEML